jgi:hypothetical protein
MKLNLISLYLATSVWAAPFPQMGGHDHDNEAGPAKGLGDLDLSGILGSAKLGGMDLSGPLGTAMAKVMAPLPLHKKTISQPVSKKPGVIREQLYYGPLALKTVVVSDDDLTQYLKVTSYRKNRKRNLVLFKWIPRETSSSIQSPASLEMLASSAPTHLSGTPTAILLE